mmetsp:Transcript_69992/g.182236  ORF Transcript_69992/g.182236 Transcript_69992/m.182236 type:complete len:325 (-) Transcript_69992:274-1248(-)
MHLVQQGGKRVAVVEADKVLVQLLLSLQHGRELECRVVGPRARLGQCTSDQGYCGADAVPPEALRCALPYADPNLRDLLASGVSNLEQSTLHCCLGRLSLPLDQKLGAAQRLDLAVKALLQAWRQQEAALEVADLSIDEAKLHLQRLHRQHLPSQIAGRPRLRRLVIHAIHAVPTRRGGQDTDLCVLQKVLQASRELQLKHLTQSLHGWSQRARSRYRWSNIRLLDGAGDSLWDDLRSLQDDAAARGRGHNHGGEAVPNVADSVVDDQLEHPLRSVPDARRHDLDLLAANLLEALHEQLPDQHVLHARAFPVRLRDRHRRRPAL